MTTEDLRQGFHYCMHGLGAYKGLRQTNTLEALDYWYKKGVRVFEMDIAMTEDDQFVAVAHSVDAPSMKRLDIIEKPDHYTIGWFMSKKLFPVSTKGLTPISLQMIPQIMDMYSDAIIMFDLYGLFEFKLADQFCNALDNQIKAHEKLRSRMLIEAYNLMMLDAICKHKYEPIYCARYEHDLGKTTIALRIKGLKDFGVRFISYPWKYNKLFPGEISEYVRAGMTVFSRTVYNTKINELQAAGININIIAYRFDGMKTPFQVIAYFAACTKRIVAKKIVSLQEKKLRR